MAAFSVALFLTSCTFFQKAETPADGTPAANSQTERPGNIFHTRGKKAAQEEQPNETAQEPQEQALVPTEETQEQVLVPTEEQQKAAQAMMAPQPANDNAPAPELLSSAPETDAAAPPALPTGGLRMGSIVPQEEAASVGNAPVPTANSAERFGLRSPKMPSKLPMGINGKLKSTP